MLQVGCPLGGVEGRYRYRGETFWTCAKTAEMKCCLFYVFQCVKEFFSIVKRSYFYRSLALRESLNGLLKNGGIGKETNHSVLTWSE